MPPEFITIPGLATFRADWFAHTELLRDAIGRWSVAVWMMNNNGEMIKATQRFGWRKKRALDALKEHGEAIVRSMETRNT